MEHKSSKEPTWLPWREMFIGKHYVIRNSFPTRCIIASLVKYFCIQKLFSFFFFLNLKAREMEWGEGRREGGKKKKLNHRQCRQRSRSASHTASRRALSHLTLHLWCLHGKYRCYVHSLPEHLLKGNLNEWETVVGCFVCWQTFLTTIIIIITRSVAEIEVGAS